MAGDIPPRYRRRRLQFDVEEDMFCGQEWKPRYLRTAWQIRVWQLMSDCKDSIRRRMTLSELEALAKPHVPYGLRVRQDGDVIELSWMDY